MSRQDRELEHTHDMSGRRYRGETEPLLIPPSAVANTAYRVLVLASGTSNTAGVRVEILVPEASGRMDEVRYVRCVGMRKVNGNGKMYFQCKDPELLAGVNRA
jgi:hypothetical protein